MQDQRHINDDVEQGDLNRNDRFSALSLNSSSSFKSYPESTTTTPDKPPSIIPTTRSSLIAIFSHSPINLLLVFIPIGFLSSYFKWGGGSSDLIIFILNALAIIPLAGLLGFATEEIALRTNQSIGGLLNATFGNAVELIVTIIALKAGLIDVVQAALLGSILSNCLLVLGCCFLFGGFKFQPEQKFNMAMAQTQSSLLAISVSAIMIPTAFSITTTTSIVASSTILSISRGISIILILVYLLYLVFQLKTHSHYFANQDIGKHDNNQKQLTLPISLSLLLLATILVSFNADFMVASITGLTEKNNLSRAFISLIVLPIITNAAEHFTAVSSALKNKMGLALNVSLGSSTQIALFVVPLTVLVGWGLDVPMTLQFTAPQTIILFLSVFLVNGIVVDGSSNWLEGALLLLMYFIVGVSFWFI